MVIESNIPEILLNSFPEYNTAPDKRIFPVPVLFNMGWDRHACICLLWHFTVTPRTAPRVLMDVIFVFSLQVKQKWNSNNKFDPKKLNILVTE